MKTVFNTAMVAHVWAQGRQEEGRTPGPGRVFFEGPRLYSYGRHFLTAYRLPDGAAFLNSARYSVSTSRHQSDARHAIRGRVYPMPGEVMAELAAILDSRVFNVESWVWPDGFESDSPYGHDGRARSEAKRVTREGSPEDLAAALPRLLKLFLAAKETPDRESMVAALHVAGATTKDAYKGADSVIAAHAKRAAAEKAAAEKAARERAARDAREAAGRPLSDFATIVASARADLKRHNWRGAAEREAGALLDQAKRLFKARKEAKARGWTRVAADLLAREKLLRQGAAGMEDFANRVDARARWAEHRQFIRAGIRAAAGDMAGRSGPLIWTEAARGALALGNACRNGLDGHRYMQKRAALVGADLARMAEGLAELEKTFRAMEEAARRQERAEALAKAAADLAAWRDGVGRLPGRLTDTEGGALLRAVKVERDDSGAIVAGTLETSQGASVPLTHALRAFRFLKLCRDSGKEWRANGKTLPVGHFRVDHIDSTGGFRAGCHRINWPEVAALAARLGVLDMAPADTTEARAHA